MKSKQELQNELNETQRFINACEMAQSNRIGLDEATYDKYNRAIKRQKELTEALNSMSDSSNLLRTTAQFRRKEPRIEKNECVIEKVVELDKSEFEDFSQALLADYDFLIENRDSMFVDELGVTHALLVIGERHEDGILVDSQGSSYIARL